ncbi:UMP-CMP kinase 2, mitochondrial-like isoform X2 [Macrosteles quadrilineatus]|uniref:UMP-CMP kinase 2, mitochondrial-like isoform X2 n=1 Tax=Macrosteles quadrilineatus TaxID=74068 RepID=UPI0023E0FABA|nr:UMP-CMP kinase 2, mitochondrial-like isoform X2 [Macrosteles quadrilineatus]
MLQFANSSLIQSLVQVFKVQCIPPEPLPEPPVRKVFIALEGTHNSGRNNMLRRMAQMYQGYALTNPPRCLAHLKADFHGTKHERKVYLALSNYASAFDVQSVWHQHPVFMSSYYYDQLAFNIAWGHATPADLPPAGSNIYEWPEDLLIPDLTVLLNAHHSIRNRISTTKENYMFQRKIVTAFDRFVDPPILTVNATNFYEDSFFKIRNYIQKIWGYTLTVNATPEK